MTGALQKAKRQGKSKLLLDEKEKPIGIQILGPSAGELISEWVAVMNGKCKTVNHCVSRASLSYPRRNQQKGCREFLFRQDIFRKSEMGLKILLQPERKSLLIIG